MIVRQFCLTEPFAGQPLSRRIWNTELLFLWPLSVCPFFSLTDHMLLLRTGGSQILFQCHCRSHLPDRRTYLRRVARRALSIHHYRKQTQQTVRLSFLRFLYHRRPV